MGAIQLGSFTLQIDLFVILAALLMAGAVMLVRLKLDGIPLRGWTDWIATVLFVFLMNEKFGYLWDSPSIIWQQPKALLFLQGTSSNGNVLMVIGLAAWSVHFIRKQQLELRILTDIVTHGVLISVAAYGFINAYMGMVPEGFTPLPVPSAMTAVLPPAESIWTMLLLIGLWLRRCKIGTGSDTLWALVVSGTLGMLISFAGSSSAETTLGLSTKQWIFVGLLFAAYLMVKAGEHDTEAKQVNQDQQETEDKAYIERT